MTPHRTDPTQGAVKSPFSQLSDRHYQKLRVTSGIPKELLKAVVHVGLRTLEDTPENRAFLYSKGYRGKQLDLFPLLYYPFKDTKGVEHSQINPDIPRLDADGDPIKYETAVVGGYGIACGPGQLELLLDPTVPIWIVEGFKKAAALWALGICAIGLAGVWMHRIGRKTDASQPLLPGLLRLPFEGRLVIIGYDSDLQTKVAVWLAAKNVAEELEALGAIVKFCILPHQPDGSKMGVDDFFVLGGSLEELHACVRDELPVVDFAGADRSVFEYETERLAAQEKRVKEVRKNAGNRAGPSQIPEFGKCVSGEYALQLGRTFVEIDRAICAAEHAESLSIADWETLYDAHCHVVDHTKSYAAYQRVRIFILLMEKTPEGEKMATAERVFGKGLKRTQNLVTAVKSYTEKTWRADLPIETNVALAPCSSEERTAWYHEIKRREYWTKEQGGPVTAKEIRQRTGQTRTLTDVQFCMHALSGCTGFWEDLRDIIKAGVPITTINRDFHAFAKAHLQPEGEDAAPHPADTPCRRGLPDDLGVDYDPNEPDPSYWWTASTEENGDARTEGRPVETVCEGNDGNRGAQGRSEGQTSGPASEAVHMASCRGGVQTRSEPLLASGRLPASGDGTGGDPSTGGGDEPVSGAAGLDALSTLYIENKRRGREDPPPDPTLKEKRPYHDLVLLAERGGLPHTPLKDGNKYIANVPDFCDHVLLASRRYANEKSHFWLKELSDAQKDWNRYQYQLAAGQCVQEDSKEMEEAQDEPKV
jgi:hypothetical protein